jgi:hypothetical protein
MRREHSQRISLQSYMQHTVLVTLPTVRLILSSAGAQSTDTGLEHSVGQYIGPLFKFLEVP